LEQQFKYHGLVSDADRIKLAEVTLRGAALEWHNYLGNAAPTTWATLAAAMRTRFQPIDNAVAVRGKLFALKQGTSSAADYVSSFRRLLVALPSMDDGDRLFQFMRGLNEPIARMLRMQGVKTLADAEAMAVRVGASSSQPPPSSSSSSAAAAAGSSSQMDLDNIEGLDQETSDSDPSSSPGTSILEQLLAAIQHRGGGGGNRDSSSGRGGNRSYGGPRPFPRVPHLTPQQVKERMDAGQCFGCKSTEHNSRGCPKRKVDAVTGRVTWPQAN
jgi:hypothetical protein